MCGGVRGIRRILAGGRGGSLRVSSHRVGGIDSCCRCDASSGTGFNRKPIGAHGYDEEWVIGAHVSSGIETRPADVRTRGAGGRGSVARQGIRSRRGGLGGTRGIACAGGNRSRGGKEGQHTALREGVGASVKPGDRPVRRNADDQFGFEGCHHARTDGIDEAIHHSEPVGQIGREHRLRRACGPDGRGLFRGQRAVPAFDLGEGRAAGTDGDDGEQGQCFHTIHSHPTSHRSCFVCALLRATFPALPNSRQTAESNDTRGNCTRRDTEDVTRKKNRLETKVSVLPNHPNQPNTYEIHIPLHIA